MRLRPDAEMLQPVLLIVLLWLALGLVCLANGALAWNLALRLTGRELRIGPRAGQLFWLGFGLLIAELEWFSLFHRMDRRAWIFVLVGCAAGAAQSRPLVRFARRGFGLASVPALLARLAVVLVITFVVAQSAAQPVDWYDTVSTHIQQVKWAAAYRAVPGLGNLNPKLAFDQAHHLVAALVDGGPYANRSAHLVVSFLLWATLIEWTWVLLSSPRGPSDARRKIFAALTLPFLAYKAHYSLEVASLSGDLAMSSVVLAGMLELVGIPPSSTALGRRRTNLALWTTATLGGATFAIKFSGLPFSAVSVAWLLYHAVRRAPTSFRSSLFLPVALLLGTVARRIVLTGWPLFPVPTLSLPFAWRVSRLYAVDEYLWIKSWARLPGVDRNEVLDGTMWRWFVPWFEGFRNSHELTVFVCGAAAALVLLTRARSTEPRNRGPLVVAATIAVACLAFWFWGAPDLRFGSVFFWMFLACTWLPILAPLYASSPTARMVLLLACLGLVHYNDGFAIKVQAPNWTELSVHPYRAMRKIELDRGTPGVFTVNVPMPGADQCGDAPLPCTHYSGLQHLRTPGRIGDGFLPAVPGR